MRQHLQSRLYVSYPSIFRRRSLPETESAMSRGIETADGWYPLLDGLCRTLTDNSCRAGRRLVEATQVKQKFGGLAFRIDDGSDVDHGAIQFANAISYFLCEETGRPGSLMVRRRWVRTLADDIGRLNGYSRCNPVIITDLPPQSGPAPGQADLPPGWQTIGSVLMSIAAQRGSSTNLRFQHAHEQLTVQHQGHDELLKGVIACACAIAARTDPMTANLRIP